jgi:DNA-binding MarR family transcriptional regulator
MRKPRPDDNSLDSLGKLPLPAPEYFFYLQFQLARQRDLFFDRALADSGLNLARWRTLAVIRRIRQCSMKELAFYSGADRTTLTRVVDQLVADGLVERWSPPRDRRRVQVTLSTKGMALYAEVARRWIAANAAMLQGIDAEALQAAIRTQQQVLRNVVGDPLSADKLLRYGDA